MDIGEKKNLLWSNIRTTSKDVEIGMDTLERKRTGSYYTSLDLTDVMMAEMIQHIKESGNDICKMRFLEPCVGAGNFVFSYLKLLSQENWEKAQYAELLNNIYVADINQHALEEYKNLLRHFATEYFGICLDEHYFQKHIGGGLLFDVAEDEPHYIPIDEVFSEEIVQNGFDIVVTNPPYKNLKAERGHYSNDNEYEMDQGKYKIIAKLASKNFRYSTSGVLNLYKIFVEEIIDRYAASKGIVSLLIPASIMSDKTCERIRTHILKDMALLSAKVIGEGSGYIDAQQALCSVLIDKGKKTDVIRVTKDFHKNPSDVACICVQDVLDKNNGNSIVAVNTEEYKVLQKIKKFPAVKDLEFVSNLRGELDLTANKQYIVDEKTGYQLLRGRNIGLYKLLPGDKTEFASAEFVEASSKNIYIHQPRIICQQIANMHKEKRVTFAYIDADTVLANSCNFITVAENLYGVDIFSVLGLFNSSVINWFFKLTSSNNHVNNYEIDCFPIPVESQELRRLSELVQEFLSTQEDSLLPEIENCALRAYGLLEVTNEQSEEATVKEKIFVDFLKDLRCLVPDISEEEAKAVLIEKKQDSPAITEQIGFLGKLEQTALKGLLTKYQKMVAGEILNHTTYKLSDLDLEMIKSVPPGGSWKDIPAATVEKSKRLKRITETGGRTTLYGRIDYDKPSYTITTYFNRPGNGTYVHPAHERVLSVREAARFQAFKDDYYFHGNKTQLLKQVGNAVPPILAYQIGHSIREKTGCTKSIDLFCGAGGMTAGFKAAGILSQLSNDIEESACITLKINNPEIPVLCGDITKEETKDLIEKVAKETGADIICGGPPCQGFSLAGFRSEDDPRNQLFREFVDIVKRVNPKVIVFENVEGLLSYQGGKTYREVHALFSELGYSTEGRTLTTTNFAVPQKRKRVIIICTRTDIGIEPASLFPEALTEKESQQVTARETIFDLESVPCGDNATYLEDGYVSNLIRFFKGESSYEQYLKNYRKVSTPANNTELKVKDAVGMYEQLSFDL